MYDLEKFNKTLPCKNKFYSSLNDKEYQHVLEVWYKFEMKMWCLIVTWCVIKI